MNVKPAIHLSQAICRSTISDMRRIKRLQSFVKIFLFSECHTITLRQEITQKQKKKLLEIREGNTTTITL
jgi:hypothetical protein